MNDSTDAADLATLTPARIAILAFGRSVVGLIAPDPAYLGLVAPADTPARQATIGDESGCMLGALGIQDAVFAVPARGPYVDGTAPRLLESRAGGYPWAPGGALRLATLEAPPEAGDSVWYGKGPGGPEHVELVSRVEVTAEGIAATCIAGGERIDTSDVEAGRATEDQIGRETVKIVVRSWRWNGHQWVDQGTGRPILAVIDCDALAARYGLRGTL